MLLSCSGGAPSSDATRKSDGCVEVGDATVRQLDWSPDGHSIVILAQEHSDVEVSSPELAIAEISYAGRDVTVLEHSADVIDSPIAIDGEGRVLWQQQVGEQVNLVRGSGPDADRWPVSGMPLLDLDASSENVVAAQVVRIGTAANDVDVLELDLDGPELATKVVEKLVGLQAQWLSGSGEDRVQSVQTEIAGPITFDVRGGDNWTAAVSDALGSPIALSSDSSRVLYRRPSTSTIASVDRDGIAGVPPVGDLQVLAFDVSPTDVIAYGNANFTGGPGEVCFMVPS